MNESNIKKDVNTAQNDWANFIIRISNAFHKNKNYLKIANELLDSLYCFNNDTIMFKPTMPGIKPFRYSRKEVLSYFIGGDDTLPYDKGFALKPWKKITFSNSNIYTRDKTIFTMGMYAFEDLNNTILDVEYTFVYVSDKDEKLKIILHHSSVPYR